MPAIDGVPLSKGDLALFIITGIVLLLASVALIAFIIILISKIFKRNKSRQPQMSYPQMSYQYIG